MFLFKKISHKIPNITFIHDYVRQVSPEGVYISAASKTTRELPSYTLIGDEKEGQRFIPYDYLVLSTGSRCVVPFKIDEKSMNMCIFPYTSTSILKNYARFLNATHLVVVGGGPTGIEIAGELAYCYKSAKITLLHRSDVFAKGSNIEIHKHILKQLARFKNLTVKLGREVAEVKNGVVYVKQKAATPAVKNQDHVPASLEASTPDAELEELQADAIFICCGLQPRTECLENYMNGCLDPQTREVLVNSKLQVATRDDPKSFYPNIFAAGDIVNLADDKLAQVAMLHANTVANNIKKVDKAKSEKHLEKHKIAERIQIISTGQGKALMVKGDKILTEGLFSAKIKQMLRTKVMYGVKETIF